MGITIQKNEKTGFFTKAIFRMKSRILIYGVPAIILAVLSTLLVLHMQTIANLVFGGLAGQMQRELKVTFGLIALLIPTAVCNAVLKACYARQTVSDFKGAYLRKIFSFPLELFLKKDMVSYLAKLSNEMPIVEQNYIIASYDAMYQGLMLAVGIVLAVNVSIKILVGAVLLLAVIFLFVLILEVNMAKLVEPLLAAQDRFTRRCREMLSGFRVIQANNLREYIGKEIGREIEKAEEGQRKIGLFSVKVNVATQIATSLLTCGMILYVIIQVMRGNMAIGQVLSFLVIFAFVLMPGVELFQTLPAIKEGKLSLVRISKLLKEVEEETESAQERKELCTFRHSIIGTNLAAAYGGETSAFTELSFHVEKGKKYLITGDSGCGKSTLLKLLRGIMDPVQGEILYDGIPLREITKESLYGQIAYLSQQIYLFDDSLKNNICMFRECPEKELRDAIEIAQLTDYVNGLSQGIHHQLKENGNNISGGEKARVALARALVNGAPILLLDEPFANLDAATMAKVEYNLLKTDRTVINVSHVTNQENFTLYDGVIRM